MLGMPDCERLKLLNITFDTIKGDQNEGTVNEQPKQGKSKTNQNSKINLQLDRKK